MRSVGHGAITGVAQISRGRILGPPVHNPHALVRIGPQQLVGRRPVGMLGLGIGLLTISDLALPFVWHHKYGYWPMRWVLAFVGSRRASSWWAR